MSLWGTLLGISTKSKSETSTTQLIPYSYATGFQHMGIGLHRVDDLKNGRTTPIWAVSGVTKHTLYSDYRKECAKWLLATYGYDCAVSFYLRSKDTNEKVKSRLDYLCKEK
jgi:hypothetical protein